GTSVRSGRRRRTSTCRCEQRPPDEHMLGSPLRPPAAAGRKGGTMSRHLAVLAFAGLALAAAAPAPAASGAQRFDGVIVTSGVSGQRTVLSSPVVARGVLNAVGKIVEVDNLPGDPDEVSRDDLVFAGGSMHLVSVTNDASFQVDP